MEVIKKTIICDICKKNKPTQKVNYPVLFLTEQTEGRAVKPYISNQTLDMCAECIRTHVCIQGVGAMGYNEYSDCIPENGVWNTFELKEVK